MVNRGLQGNSTHHGGYLLLWKANKQPNFLHLTPITTKQKSGYMMFAIFYPYSCFLEIPVGFFDTKKLDNVSNVNHAKEQMTANANMGIAEMSLFSAPAV